MNVIQFICSSFPNRKRNKQPYIKGELYLIGSVRYGDYIKQPDDSDIYSCVMNCIYQNGLTLYEYVFRTIRHYVHVQLSKPVCEETKVPSPVYVYFNEIIENLDQLPSALLQQVKSLNIHHDSIEQSMTHVDHWFSNNKLLFNEQQQQLFMSVCRNAANIAREVIKRNHEIELSNHIKRESFNHEMQVYQEHVKTVQDNILYNQALANLCCKFFLDKSEQFKCIY